MVLGLLVQPRRGELVVDFCAGAGGKTLQLGAMMHRPGACTPSTFPAARQAQAAHGACQPVERASGADRPRADARSSAWRARPTACWSMRPAPGWARLRRNPDLKVAPVAGGGRGDGRQTGRDPRRGALVVRREAAWCMPPAACSPRRTTASSTPSWPRIPSSARCRRRKCWRRRAWRWRPASACACCHRVLRHRRLLCRRHGACQGWVSADMSGRIGGRASAARRCSGGWRRSPSLRRAGASRRTRAGVSCEQGQIELAFAPRDDTEKVVINPHPRCAARAWRCTPTPSPAATSPTRWWRRQQRRGVRVEVLADAHMNRRGEGHDPAPARRRRAGGLRDALQRRAQQGADRGRRRPALRSAGPAPTTSPGRPTTCNAENILIVRDHCELARAYRANWLPASHRKGRDPRTSAVAGRAKVLVAATQIAMRAPEDPPAVWRGNKGWTASNPETALRSRSWPIVLLFSLGRFLACTTVSSIPGGGLRAGGARAHPRHHRLRHRLPASPSGAPRLEAACAAQPFLPLLAMADHRHGHQGVGGDPPQAPREVRDRGGPAQPADAGPAKVLWEGRSSTAPRRRMSRRCSATATARPDDWL